MGRIQSFISQTWPPWSKFSIDQIPDLSGKVVIITGGNTGVGYETAKALLPRNARVYIACCNAKKASDAIDKLCEDTGKDSIFLPLDLASFKSIRVAADEFLRKEKELPILFNNVQVHLLCGVIEPNIDELTEEGYDLAISVNVVVSQNTTGTKARIVNMASFAAKMNVKPDYDPCKDGPIRWRLGTVSMYYQSKFAGLLYSTEFSHRYFEAGIVCTCINPGNLVTELQRNLKLGVKRFIIYRILYPAPYSALTQLYAGTSPEGADFNGKYLVPWAHMWTSTPESQDKQAGSQLWAWLEDQVKDT
ncbi:NAD-P-binding protein [Guyanagaster necrorhizus]|uniref:NAD-P-binding protein n=1 Tax=Guyanagaster necrorhizus TaxID=856835 RepID=A0A9P7VS82_9AGAR|nr:NAD-P-binding protein [Guyanagaster necrorhizus MCA 3950]KAG7445703.1 NAD-P-binding protein [Guyanagaster necrorhizus MCA 3950]